MCNILACFTFCCDKIHLLHCKSGESCFFFIYIFAPQSIPTFGCSYRVCVWAVSTSGCVYFMPSDLIVEAFDSFGVVIGVLVASSMTLLFFHSPRLRGQPGPGRWMCVSYSFHFRDNRLSWTPIQHFGNDKYALKCVNFAAIYFNPQLEKLNWVLKTTLLCKLLHNRWKIHCWNSNMWAVDILIAAEVRGQ